jgi:tripartite-type tricarboxylate transporter receptor subunit TctC
MSVVIRIASVAIVVLASAAGAASDFPSKPVTILVPFAPGGTADLVARFLAPGLSRDLGQPVVVENKSGAGGTIATTTLARATPDGHTVLIHHMGITFNSILYERLPYELAHDIGPVCMIGRTPNVLTVPSKAGSRSLDDFLAKARAHPGAVSYGSGGMGSAGHIPMEMLQAMTGLKLVHVPYKGSGPAISDLLGGQIDAMFLTIPSVKPYIDSGRLQAIATSAGQRSRALPNVPTLAELGVAGFDYSPWYGAFVPARTPAAIQDRLHAAFEKVLGDPEVEAKLREQGLEVHRATRAEFSDQVQSDSRKWGEILRTLGIKGGG